MVYIWYVMMTQKVKISLSGSKPFYPSKSGSTTHLTFPGLLVQVKKKRVMFTKSVKLKCVQSPKTYLINTRGIGECDIPPGNRDGCLIFDWLNDFRHLPLFINKYEMKNECDEA